ncbi:MAG: hypothetical protein RB191_05540 [Terriglobia bacterium]|nr:hypothetical protein [Terriglobia bacterium]
MHLIGLLGAKGVGKDTLAKMLVQQLGFRQTSFARELYREIAFGFRVPVEFLQNRDTKESPLEALKLSKCLNAEFVETAMMVLRKDRLREVGRSVAGERLCSLRPQSSSEFPASPGIAERREELERPRSPRQILQWWGTEYRVLSVFGHRRYWVNFVRDEIDREPDRDFVISDVRLFHEADFTRERQGLLVRVRSLETDRAAEAARARGDRTALHSSETELAGCPLDAEVFNVPGRPESMLPAVQELLHRRRHAA